MLSEALDRDLLVRIGWGRGGDEKPKEGEIGVITHLPEKSRVLLLGNLGECAGAMNQGGNFTLQGNCSSMAGAFQEKGRIIIEKDAGDKIGSHMTGGIINVQGSVSNNAGELMNGGTIIVRGHSGERTGAGMSGGTIIVLGSVGKEPGVGMSGGKIIVAGNCPPPGQGADMRSMKSNEILEISEHLEPLGLSINKDALVIVAADKSDNYAKSPKSSITEGFEKIAITTSSNKILSEYNALDNYTLINSMRDEEEGLLFPVPWLIERDNGITDNSEIVSRQPFLVKSNPRKNDLIIIDKENIISATKDLGKCSGIVLNMASLPVMNDAEIEALIVSMTSKIQEKSLIMLKDFVEIV
jgi:formylmethanofuran dehydrogenase subunit C